MANAPMEGDRRGVRRQSSGHKTGSTEELAAVELKGDKLQNRKKPSGQYRKVKVEFFKVNKLNIISKSLRVN